MRPIIFLLLSLAVTFSADAQLQQIITTSPGSTAREAYTISNENDVYINNRVDSLRDNLGGGSVDLSQVGITKYDGAVNGLRSNSIIQAPGQITLTNGSNAVTGIGTSFLDATTGIGVSYWWSFFVKDANNVWHRIELSAIPSNTSATLIRVWNETQWTTYQNSTAGSYGPSLATSTFSGVTGTYDYYTVMNFSKGPFSNAFGNTSYVGGQGFGTAFGGQTVVLGLGGTAFGINNFIANEGTTSFVSGNGNTAKGAYNFMMGRAGLNEGNYAVTLGYRPIAQAEGAFVGGLGSGSGWVRSTGRGSFTYTTATTRNIENGAAGAVMLGGENHNIPSTSPRSVVLGGNTINVAANTPDVVHMPKLRIGLGTGGALSTDNALTSVLVRDATTGEVKIRSASTLTGWATTGNTSLTGNAWVFLPSAGTGEFSFINEGEEKLMTLTDQSVFIGNDNSSLGLSISPANGIVWSGLTQDDTKSQVLVKDGTSNRMFWRDASTIGGGGGSAWGGITGTLSDQTDLQTALNGKANLTANTFTGKQIFTTTSTDAALRIGSFASDPSSLSSGDIWYNSSLGRLRGYWGGPARGFNIAGFSLLETEPSFNELLSYGGNAGLIDTDIFSRGSGVYEFGDPSTSQSITLQNGTVDNGDFRIVHTTTGFGGMVIESENNSVSIESALGTNIISNHNDGVKVYQSTSGTNDVQTALAIRRLSTGTPAIGIGTRLSFDVEANAGASSELAASIDVTSTAVVNGAESFDISFNTMNAGAARAEKLLIRSTGAIKITTTPVTDNTEDLVLVRDAVTGNIEGRSAATIGGAGGSSWGAITGTLSDQTDLQSALDAKADDSEIMTINSTLAGLPTFLSASATLDFASTGATAVNTLTIPVVGAVVGNPCTVGAPAGSVTATSSYWCWVSAADVVSVRLDTNATENPASGTFTVVVTQP